MIHEVSTMKHHGPALLLGNHAAAELHSNGENLLIVAF